MSLFLRRTASAKQSPLRREPAPLCGAQPRARNVMDYAVVLTVDEDDNSVERVRVCDGAHGINEMHRFDRDGRKSAGKTVHTGTLGKGMRAAITAVRTGYKKMIDAWHAT